MNDGYTLDSVLTRACHNVPFVEALKTSLKARTHSGLFLFLSQKNHPGNLFSGDHTKLTALFLSSSTARNSSVKSNAIAYLARAARIEDPTTHLPGTIDCLSCHAANMTKLLTAKALGVPPPTPQVSNRINLKNTSHYYGDTHNLRMLGYVNSELQLGDRVIYESATVAEYLSKIHLHSKP